MEAEKPATKRQRTKYDAAFRAEAIRRVTQDGQAATRVAQALGLSEALLGHWVRAARAQATRPAGSEGLEQENKQLRAQLARAEMERDILKIYNYIFTITWLIKCFTFIVLHADCWPVRQQC